MGLGDTPISKTFALVLLGPEFEFPKPTRKARHKCVIQALWRQSQADSWNSLASEPSLVVRFRTMRDLVSEHKVGGMVACT